MLQINDTTFSGPGEPSGPLKSMDYMQYCEFKPTDRHLWPFGRDYNMVNRLKRMSASENRRFKIRNPFK